MRKLTCPHCGFSKEVAADRIPAGMTKVNCPKCREQFSLELPAGLPPAIAPDSGVQPVVQSGPAGSAAMAAPGVPPPAKTAAPPVRDQDRSASSPDAMTLLTCPHCGNQRQIPVAKIPARPVKVACAGCGQTFPLHRDQLSAPATGAKPTPAPPGSAPEPAAPRHRLLKIGSLFEKVWDAFKQRILLMLVVYLAALGPLCVTYLLFGWGLSSLTGMFGESPWLIAPLVLAMAGLTAVVLSAAGGAMTYALVDEDLGVRHCLAYGLQNFHAFLWVFVLLGFIISGGYLLLVVPGLLFLSWFGFAQFILAEEDVRGMEALLKSRAYVRGHELPVCGRVLLVTLFGGALAAIPVLGPLLSLIIAPLTLIFYHEIYRDLRELKGSISYSVSRGEKFKWLAAGGAGYLVLLLILLWLFGTFLLQGLGVSGSGTWAPPADPAPVSRPAVTPQQPRPGAKPQPATGQLFLAQQQFAPGDTFSVGFEAPPDLPTNAWIGLVAAEVASGDSAQLLADALDYHFLSGGILGEIRFNAPQTPGRYVLQMYSSDQGGQLVAQAGFEVIGEEREPAAPGLPALAAEAPITYPSPIAAAAQPAPAQVLSPDSISISAPGEDRRQVRVSLDALNYSGDLRLNGDELYVMQGERGRNDNYTGGVWLESGSNTLEINYTAIPEPRLMELRLRLFEANPSGGPGSVLGEWNYQDPQGNVSIEIYLEN